MQTLVKYLLLQIPGLLVAAVVLVALWQWGKVSGTTAAFGLLLWVGKDLALYPFLRPAYRSDVPTGTDRLLGRSAVVRRRLEPAGYVLVQGELWRAEVPVSHPPVPVATAVKVVGARRFTLIVELDSSDAA